MKFGKLEHAHLALVADAFDQTLVSIQAITTPLDIPAEPKNEKLVFDPSTGEATVLPESLVVLCNDIHPRFCEYVVRTTHSEVKSIIDMYRARPIAEVAGIFRGVFQNLIQWSDAELNSLYETKNGIDWQNWCNDAVIFLSIRVVLLGRPIPIMDPVTENDKGNKRKTAMKAKKAKKPDKSNK
jgi:hypothetical protein